MIGVTRVATPNTEERILSLAIGLINTTTGGALATGKPGLYDAWETSTALTRTYDNFFVAVPVADAAIFSSQSAEVRPDRYQRENSAGAFMVKRDDYEGQYCLIPPAGQEGRKTELLAKASRNNIDSMSDPAIDDLALSVGTTPRCLVVPEV